MDRLIGKVVAVRTLEQYREDAARSTILKRPGTAAASFVTGTLLFVDGGLTAM